MSRRILREHFSLQQKIYNTKSGKNPLLIYVDPKTSTDNTFGAKDKFKEYSMIYLPSKLGNYAPHAWGWILWDGKNDKQMGFVKKFVNDLPKLETPQENGKSRGFDEITSGLDKIVADILRDIDATEGFSSNGVQDEDAKRRIEEFKNMLQNELGNEKTQEFVKSLIEYRKELKKHNMYALGWTNIMLAYFAREGKATQIRPLKEWERMGYQPKSNIQPIVLIGKNCKHIPYTKEQKEKIIQSYLEEKGVSTVDELPKSSQYDLFNRRLKGRIIPGTEYQFAYNAYDILDVQPIHGEAERDPEEPDENWWWDKLPADEKDNALTEALIKFAESDECGNITIKADNTKEGLGGARGNATNTGIINLIDDGMSRFPTAVHELTHQLRHWEFASANNPKLKRFYNRFSDRDIREQEAELCASFVISNYGYDLQPHLNYVFNWGLGKDNCNKIFDQIAEVADFIEKGIQKYLTNLDLIQK